MKSQSILLPLPSAPTPADCNERFSRYLAAAGLERRNCGRGEWSGLLRCQGCSCMVEPNWDAGRIYLDRYALAGDPCERDRWRCACHRLPSSVPEALPTLLWVCRSGDRLFPFTAGWPAGPGSPDCSCCADGAAVAFVNLSGLYDDGDPADGAYWWCEDCLLSSLPEWEEEADETFREPGAMRSLRERLEAMLALGWRPGPRG